MRTDQIWQNRTVAESFLTGVRGAIPFATEQIDIALRVLDQLEPPMRRVADLGCGDGAIAYAILTHYPEAHVTAIDFSPPMLEQARQRLQPFGKRVDVVQADLYTPDWQNSLEPFDAVLSGYCIHHLPNDRKQALYREIFHLLRSGGGFLQIEHVASATPWVEALFNDTLVEAIYQWHQAQGDPRSREEIGQTFVYREDKKANILVPVDVQCEWLRAIGFQQVDCFFKFFELAVFGGIR
ncbi:class I SAM-dependent methyltransferase [Phormidium sp. FACHB-592]|uniref:Class I SAM-dependent methyltransferase n=1 Tax=Stenomitos frigidus AS-A4 TaxID=2933935 RepID=A0ABV0KJJ0_9CYAN|nr:class I SAM-dependent methyltransferase [Phormidium sp. FACHB-592]MBD2074554.1 class I SAM-dependent methyltransferase [Phormidium sp. FACHB-592]